MDIKELIEKMEERQKYNFTNESKMMFNTPNRLFISSEQGFFVNNTVKPNTYNSFTVNLPRPCLNVKTLQLVSANIPSTTGLSFSDNELVFFYYRIRTQRNFDDTLTIYNEQPSLDNLYYVRLLPSYYKPELIPNNHLYGFNKSFGNYHELSEELAKACINDLAYTNKLAPIPYLPDDITIRYNESYNKFEMKGNNVNNRLIAGSPPVWSEAVQYYINDIIFYLGSFYIATENNNSLQPTEHPEIWAPYLETSNTIWNTYLIAGYNDPNVQMLMGDSYTYTFPTWTNNIKYMANNRVSYNNRTYRALIDNTNVAPIVPSVWEDIGGVPFTGLGINGISRLYDNNFNQYNVSSLEGIPPQPFLNKKTLNLRLGFTWNGIYYWINQVNVIGYTDANYEPQLYNRLRPVPQYELIPETELEDPPLPIPLPSTGNPYKATTFLADGYCNLVLSSTIYVYTSIIGASTIDTFRNNNLLAIIPLDCSTLGITFANTFIDNPLTKINNDIYSIYFEFRNEKGELHDLGHNGICSFVLKLEY